jgi:hypothetical protein
MEAASRRSSISSSGSYSTSSTTAIPQHTANAQKEHAASPTSSIAGAIGDFVIWGAPIIVVVLLIVLLILIHNHDSYLKAQVYSLLSASLAMLQTNLVSTTTYVYCPAQRWCGALRESNHPLH